MFGSPANPYARAGQASKSRGRREGTKPHERRTDLLGDASPDRQFEAPKVGIGGSPSDPRPREQGHRREAVSAVPRGRRLRADRPTFFSDGEVSPIDGSREAPLGARPVPPGRRCACEPSGSCGFEDPRPFRVSEGAETQESSGSRRGATHVTMNGLTKGRTLRGR